MRRPWLTLAILSAINMLNYIDRYVVPPVGENIKASLHTTDAQFGALATVFLLVYMLAAPFFGAVGDRPHRTRWIATGVVIWSIATACSGLAQNYFQLATSRAVVGIGEASYSALAPALIADFFEERLRGRVFALFYAAIPLGAALGYMIGGIVGHHIGWRYAFFVVGTPGILFALAALTIDDPGPQRRPDVDPSAQEKRGLGLYLPLFSNAPYIRTVLGYAAYTFAMGGIAVWMPTFLMRVRGMPTHIVDARLGPIIFATGLLGTFLGGWLADGIKKRVPQAYLWICGISTIAAAPVAWIALTTPNHTLCWIAIALAEILLFTSTGPVNSAIVSQVPPAARAAAMAASIVAIHTLGDGPSPLLIGWISDTASLDRAVLIIPVAIAISGIAWIYAATRGNAGGPDLTAPSQ